MTRGKFPPIEEATHEGLLAIGGDLSVETLLEAYTQGIFPWPHSERGPITWFSPDPRGVLFYDNLICPKSFKKFLKKCPFHLKLNTNFEKVIDYCSKLPRPHQKGTWISPKMVKAYIQLFRANHAFSIEVYNENDDLVGGLYGVHIGKLVAGESMFYLEPNASKFALYSLMKYLKNFGIEWIDTQMKTSVIEQFGGIEIRRSDYQKLLNKSIHQKISEEVFRTNNCLKILF